MGVISDIRSEIDSYWLKNDIFKTYTYWEFESKLCQFGIELYYSVPDLEDYYEWEYRWSFIKYGYNLDGFVYSFKTYTELDSFLYNLQYNWEYVNSLTDYDCVAYFRENMTEMLNAK